MNSSSERSGLGLFTSLSTMMFVMFFVWGAWYPTMGSFMTEKGLADHINWAYSVAPIAAIITPFFMGLVADRLMNAEKLQGILMILSGICISIAPSFASPDTWLLFILLLLAHTICFMPNLGLSNTICLKHLVDADRDYPIVRVFATVGWVAAGWIISALTADKTAMQFYVAGSAAIAVGLYSFVLPKTPPPARDKPLRFGELYGADTFPYFKHWSFTVFMLASLFACIGMMPYWALGSPFLNAVGIEKTARFLTMGQIAEVFVLALVLPMFVKRFGIKWTMILGLTSWAIRFVLFAAAATRQDIGGQTMLVLAIVLHGFSYDFVFVSGYLYVDRYVREDIRAQAQGLLVVFTQGIGFFLSSQIFVGEISRRMIEDSDSAAQWQSYWLVPAIYMAIVLVMFSLCFRDQNSNNATESG